VKLENFILLENVFNDIGITKNWFKALCLGDTKLYNDGYDIVNYYVEDGICIINSGSRNNRPFTLDMIKDIITIVKQHDKVILSSSVKSMATHIERKYGGYYNVDKSVYYKGDFKWA
jgi:hypothetical protein